MAQLHPGSKDRRAHVRRWGWTLAAGAFACGPSLVPTVPAPVVLAGAIEHSVFFIGDAGAPAVPTDPVLIALRAAASEHPERNSIVFLGDNVYPMGMPVRDDPSRQESERRLQAQIDAVPQGARGIFVMGNHDWIRGREGGLAAVRRQLAYIADAGRPLVVAAPTGGCPGPAVIDVSARLRLVMLGTQWWLHGSERPSDPASACIADSEAEVTDSLRTVVQAGPDRIVLVAGHHPLRSGGVHGGKFDWKDHIFPLRVWKSWLWLPLPIIGSLYPLVRGSGFSAQDLGSGRYQTMRDSIVAAFGSHPPLAYAAGHEHNLQVLDGMGARYLLVSGAGIYDHLSQAFRLEGSLYARAASGFIRIDLLRDGRVRLAVLLADGDGRLTEDFSMWLEENR